jgi:hypothetical protein
LLSANWVILVKTFVFPGLIKSYGNFSPGYPQNIRKNQKKESAKNGTKIGEKMMEKWQKKSGGM